MRTGVYTYIYCQRDAPFRAEGQRATDALLRRRMSARRGPESALSGGRPRHPRQPGPERRPGPPCRLGPPARLWLPPARWSQPSAAACCTPAASWQYLGTPGPVGGGRRQDAPPTLTSPGWVPPAVAPGPARREAGPGGGPQQWPGAAGPALSVGHPGRGARVPRAARVCGGLEYGGCEYGCPLTAEHAVTVKD